LTSRDSLVRFRALSRAIFEGQVDDMPIENGKSSTDPDLKALNALGEKLKAKRTLEKQVENVEGNTGMAVGLKYASEFSAATLVGAALGYGVDHLAGSAPWGLLVGLFLGFCAGVMNVVRLAKQSLDTEDLGQDLPHRNEE